MVFFDGVDGMGEYVMCSCNLARVRPPIPSST